MGFKILSLFSWGEEKEEEKEQAPRKSLRKTKSQYFEDEKDRGCLFMSKPKSNDVRMRRKFAKYDSDNEHSGESESWFENDHSSNNSEKVMNSSRRQLSPRDSVVLYETSQASRRTNN